MRTLDRRKLGSPRNRRLAGWIALALAAQGALAGQRPAPLGAPRSKAARPAVERIDATPPSPPKGELQPTVVHSVRGYLDDGRPVVEWQTGSQAATIGFRLFRVSGQRAVPVDEGWIAPPWNAPAGSIYRVVDRSILPGKSQQYVIVERDEQATEHLHGPFDVEFVETTGPPVEGPMLVTPRLRAGSAQSAGPPTRDVIPGDTPKTVAKAFVRTDGLYRVTAAELASALGQSTAKVETLIARERVAIESQGAPVSWFTDGSSGELLFYGTAIDSPYTLDNVYWIRLGEAASIASTVTASASAAQPGTYFPSGSHAEVDAIPAIATTKIEGVDYWYWDGIRAESPTENKKSFQVASPDVALDGGEAQLMVRLAGATTGTGYRYHYAVISVNGVEVGSIIWIGLFTMEQTLSFDASLLAADNTVEVEGRLFPGALGSAFFVDSFDLTYPRYYRAVGDELLLTGDVNPVVTVEGLGGTDVVVLDLENAAQPMICDDLLVEPDAGSYRVSFTPESPTAPHVATTLSAAHAVDSLVADTFYSDPWQSTAGHDFVIVVPEALREPAARLMAHRAAQGLDPYLLVLEDLHDSFADGIADPWAVRDFLAWAADNWTVQPRYLMLVGKGTFDPKDNEGYGDNLLTPVLAATPYGMSAADNLLADIDGDRIPELAIGRLPVLTAEAFDGYVTKVIDFENATGAWLDEALMLADTPDAAGDFTTLSESAIGHLPSEMTAARVYLESLDIDSARATMFGDWTQGKRLVNYIGHGGVDVFSAQSLLSGSDMPIIEGAGTAAVVAALSCVVGKFELPGFDSLSESLLGVADGGAVAMWAPTSPSFSGAAKTLNESFFDQLAIPGERVGDGVLAAIEAAAPGGATFLLETFTLLGDPALRVR